ncbi:MAG: FAD-dependent oxidoreductase [Bacteroidota bacterium]
MHCRTSLSRASAKYSPLVKLNTPITSVNYSADPIVLTSKDGTKYEVNKLIVTVPVSVLKKGTIAFSPGLSGDFNGALSKFAMGPSYGC